MQCRGGVVTATKYIRRMRGGAQSHLVRCSDGRDYVVKFRNNPQGVRILANEFIFSNLGRSLGFTLANHKVVFVENSFVRENENLKIWLPSNCPILCESGLHFGSELVMNPIEGRLSDILEMPLSMPMSEIRNPQEFVGILALDKWACNRDNRQAILWRHSRQKKYTATFIDHGWCFGQENWELGDRWMNGFFPRKEVYANVVGWHSFEPWLSKLETLSPDIIWGAMENTPPSWYDSDWSSLEKLGETLIDRRRIIRDLIDQFRLSERNPFPNWRDSQAA